MSEQKLKDLLTEEHIAQLVANFYILHKIVNDKDFDKKINKTRNFVAKNQMNKMKTEINNLYEEFEDVGKKEE